MKLYHVTTERKAKKYRQTGYIQQPVRGFANIKAAMFWAMRTGRRIIYEIEVETTNVYKLPDHQNQFGQAFWTDKNIHVDDIKCVVSAT